MMKTPSQTSLEHERLFTQLQKQNATIKHHFPNRGLSQVSPLIEGTFERAPQIAHRIMRPNYWIRALVCIISVTMLCFVVVGLLQLQFSNNDGWSVLEGIEAGISTAVYSGVAIVFFVSLEIRQRRQMTLKALQELRALAHVLDMHQMNKDTDYILSPFGADGQGESRRMNPAELERYLSHTADLLSLIGKLAAWYAQQVNDPEVLMAINEIEQLTGDMVQRTWQKISIIHAMVIRHHETETMTEQGMDENSSVPVLSASVPEP